jgi:F0F1-type ATP synthase membrane subunit a
MKKKLNLGEVTWQIVVMFVVAFTSVTVAFVLTNMTPEQYSSVIQLVLSFFAGFIASKVVDSARCEK